MVAPGLTLSVNLPSKSVATPFDVPFTTTLAPITGPMASLTTPVIFFSCCTSLGKGLMPSPVTARTCGEKLSIMTKHNAANMVVFLQLNFIGSVVRIID